VSVRKYLPRAVAVAWLLTPALAAAQTAPSWLPPLPSPTAPSPVSTDEFAPFGLRPVGPASTMDWRGFYVGGEFDYTDGSANFSGATQTPVAYSLRDTTLEAEYSPSSWQVLGTGDHSVPGFGGFAGYNFEYLSPNAKIVMGFEATYEQASLSLYAPSSTITRVLANVSDSVTISGTGSMTDLNFGTLRARAGWAAGNFLPYAFVGLALGRANVNITETTQVTETVSPFSTFTFPGTAGTNGEWIYGLSVGGGLDVAITPHIFLRGEYEYVQFQQVAGTVIELNTARVGAGIKF
jgi:outer membrane immunogenic protein